MRATRGAGCRFGHHHRRRQHHQPDLDPGGEPVPRERRHRRAVGRLPAHRGRARAVHGDRRSHGGGGGLALLMLALVALTRRRRRWRG
ncbi:MAG: hypothetical protein EXR73_08505 [Myxococcales bacterium]|nr:hypothetical protein [Myxococcales bacterium]